jgi:phosphatidate cytidylyltransferase
MKRVLTALVLIPLVLLAVFRAPDWLFTLLVGVVAVLATIEYLQIAAKYGYKVYPVVTVLCVGGLYVAMSFGLAQANVLNGPEGDVLEVALLFGALAVVFAPSILLVSAMRNQELRNALPGAALSFFAVPYVGFAMLCLVLLRSAPGGSFFVLFTFFAVWVGDTAAYYVGRSIGKTKFAPRISPKKTWEGAIASVIGAMIVGTVFARFGPRLAWLTSDRQPFYEWRSAPIWAAAVAALLINVAAQLGDLFESLIKRGADTKDSGTMLPGHGGILDRIDALLFAAPVALVVFSVLRGAFVIITGDHGG